MKHLPIKVMLSKKHNLLPEQIAHFAVMYNNMNDNTATEVITQLINKCIDQQIERMKQNDFAEQQFIGFVHARKGYDLRSLVQGMGLTQEEWSIIRERCTLSESDKNDIDLMIKK